MTTEGGPGSYVIEFFTSGPTVVAVAASAVTSSTIDASFTNLKMSWFNDEELSTIVTAEGVTKLQATFTTDIEGHSEQTLRFDWSDSVDGAGFRADVTPANDAPASVIPLPASVLLLGSALAGLGLFRRRQRVAGGCAA